MKINTTETLWTSKLLEKWNPQNNKMIKLYNNTKTLIDNNSSLNKENILKYIKTYQLDDDQYICLNTYSGAIDILSKPIVELLKSSKHYEKNLSSEEYNCLYERCYLFNSIDEESDFLAKSCAIYSFIKMESNEFRICPTYSCNLKCTYCYEGELTSCKINTMCEDTITSVFDSIIIIADEMDVKNIKIQLFGGEPLLLNTVDAVKRIFNECVKKSYKISITTNGVNILSYISLLNEYKNNLNPIRITLDGTKEVHDKRRMYHNGEGTFDEIVNSIELLLKNGISVNCRVNIDKENINSIVEVGHYIQERKWFEYNNFNCTVALVVNHSYNVNIPTLLDESEAAIKLIDLYCEDEIIKFFDFSPFRIFNQILKLLAINKEQYNPVFFYCEANHGGGIVYGPDKLIYPCNEAVGNTKLSVGSFVPSMNLHNEFKNRWANRSFFSLPYCTNCEWAPLCGGGCEHLRHDQHGNDLNKSGYFSSSGDTCKEEIDKIMQYGLKKILKYNMK